MGINRLGPNQIINRQCRLNTLGFGSFDLASVTEVANAVSQATLVTGQQRTSGQIQATDVTCTLPWENQEQVARVEAWAALAREGVEGHLQRGASLQYENQDGTPGPTVMIEECYPHTVTYPSTDASATGDAAMLTFILSVYNPVRVPGL